MQAEGFDVEKVCDEIDPDKVWKTPGQALWVRTQAAAAALSTAISAGYWRSNCQLCRGTSTDVQASLSMCLVKRPVRFFQAMRAARLAKLGAGPGAGPGSAPSGGYAEGVKHDACVKPA